MEKTSITIRNMKATDIADAMRLSDAAGWNQTEKDWKLLVDNTDNVCLLAESGDKVVGTTTAINYANEVAWVGMVLVDKEYQGQGISKTLLAAIFKKAAHFKSIKLDATPAGQRVYKKLGFIEEYPIIRLTNATAPKVVPLEDDISPEPVDLSQVKEIAELDEFIFGANRNQLITSLITESPRKSWLLKRNDSITGFALGRDGSKYHQVGPVVASTTLEAKMLLINALDDLIDQPVVLDVLADKDDLLDWLYSNGFVKQRHFTRMYKEENLLPGITSKQYLIAGPEFG